ncbi:MAG: type II toxin-antitoxin system RatA family toxin [Bauldia sp.]
MSAFATTRSVAHGATDMFDLVASVEAYPQFVPMCTGMVVRDRQTVDGRETLLARMTVSYGFLRESFTSRVVLDRAGLAILVTAIDGPFRKLENSWRFEPEGADRSVVHFGIAYEFKSRTLGMLLGGMFDRAFRRFADAFEARADAVYGR